jgi:hypothetical protein
VQAIEEEAEAILSKESQQQIMPIHTDTDRVFQVCQGIGTGIPAAVILLFHFLILLSAVWQGRIISNEGLMRLKPNSNHQQ